MLAVRADPATFPSVLPGSALLGAPLEDAPTPNDASINKGSESVAEHDPFCPLCTDEAPPGTRPSVLRFLLRLCRPLTSWERGIHPRMFGSPGTPIASDGIMPIDKGDKAPPAKDEKDVKGKDEKTKDDKASKPKGPTTFPQALLRYLHCVRTHGKALEMEANGKNGDGNGKDKKKENEDDKGGKSSPLNGSETSAGAQEPETPAPAPPSRQDELGAERGGRSVSIEGETGLLGKGFEPTWYSAHAQGTVVTSVHDVFHAPYTGPNSLLRMEPHATSETTTMFFATRLWQGGEFVFNPEVAGGRGFSGSDGIAGFPNGEITRVGIVEPTPYIARLFFRQVIGFGGEQERLEDGVNQIAGTRDIHHLTVAFGRFSMTDVADDNRFSHDPRTQFLVWSLMYNGAWDYPANVRGYTDAIAVDYNTKHWALHYGIAAEPAVANGAALDPRFLKANGQVLEWLGRYKLNERPGNLRLLTYLNRAHMGDYAEALAQMPVNPNVTLTRAYRYKYGFGMSWDQEVTKDIGIFARLGWSDGHTEAWAFTAIDRLAEGGVWINGRKWCRPNDQFGLAFNMNGLARDHRNYLAAGGLDFNIGDGKLNYGREMILEALYNLGVTRNILFTLDFQEVWNPAYNEDRGPVTIFQGRFHIEF
jgi:high affinity Mn2+ porin